MSSPAQLADGMVGVFHYTLRGDDGAVIDRSDGGPMAYLHGSHNIVAGLEEAMSGRGAGDTFTVVVPPEKGYGQHDPNGVQKVHRSNFPRNVEIDVGMEFEAAGADGHRFRVRVVEAVGAYVTIDANHPLAGQNLNFDIQVVEVRAATAEELAHGHVHGPGGHHHH
ncbi:MAG TPA: peptidylprolyl isomerase [Myxococcota bacterium]|nr:peptidylprolyl isomerase [Myxococcota bacterium]